MPTTTKSLAAELERSERQVLKYKRAVESRLGFAITYQQGRQHFYHEEYADLVRTYARGEPLPLSSQPGCPVMRLMPQGGEQRPILLILIPNALSVPDPTGQPLCLLLVNELLAGVPHHATTPAIGG